MEEISFGLTLGHIWDICFMKLVKIYLSNFYGSNTWDLFSKEFEKLLCSWNGMVRIQFDLPRNIHRYFNEPIPNTPLLKIQLIKRFIKFSNTLDKCEKPHLRYLEHLQETDSRSIFVRNCRNICIEAGAENLVEADVSNIVYAAIPEQERYRISLIQEALEMRQNISESLLSKKEIEHIIADV